MKKLVIVVLVCVVCSISANADLLLDYKFNLGTTPNTAAVGVDGGAFLIGSGLVGFAGRSTGYGGNMYARASGTANQLIVSQAIAADDYLSVTIGPDSGYAMDLTSLTFDYGYTRNGAWDGKQFKAYLLTSIDGFVDGGDIVGSKTITVGANTAVPTFTGASIDLSGAQFQGLTTATEFRFYLIDTTGGSEYIHRIDNVQLNGSVTPEPATMCLLGLGGLLLRRRKK